jgi:hypothetical protein
LMWRSAAAADAVAAGASPRVYYFQPPAASTCRNTIGRLDAKYFETGFKLPIQKSVQVTRQRVGCTVETKMFFFSLGFWRKLFSYLLEIACEYRYERFCRIFAICFLHINFSEKICKKGETGSGSLKKFAVYAKN